MNTLIQVLHRTKHHALPLSEFPNSCAPGDRATGPSEPGGCNPASAKHPSQGFGAPRQPLRSATSEGETVTCRMLIGMGVPTPIGSVNTLILLEREGSSSAL